MSRIFGCSFISCVLFFCTVISAQDNALSVYTEHFAPYTIVGEGNRLSGSAVSKVNQALTLTGIETNIEVVPWARAYNMALSQPNVLLFSMAKTHQRTPLFHWLYKITTLKYDFYSLRSGKISVASIEDALTYTTVAIRGSYEESKLLSLGFTETDNLVVVANMEQAWQMLSKGRVHTMFASHIPAQIATKHAPQYIRHQAIDDSQELYVVASLSTDVQFIEALKLAFEQLEKTSP
ncbi:substrate-binding periplasmic protein [Pseudoalteromonas luteoviolacea]|uniref:substrate-binding periplasmic protein n=1 Tax=Pseudoalteromonas luteoviolacea TaxID=43657 RepID=UPI001B378D5C|nr:transporter substrate-binding domain-containing protein [Pseudoalteromonas luteoviolacea]MBQ4839588.1 transporter substrate-binding domain-containing protein [Pseudoalteromonas luteoviolacea]